VAEYQRRRDRLAQLVNDAAEAAEELATQAQQHRESAASAGRRAASAAEAETAERAVREQEECQRVAADLDAQAAEQRGQLAPMREQLAKVDGTLNRLRGQRDLLQSRLRVAQARLQVETGPTHPRRRRRLAVAAVVGLAAILLSGVLYYARSSSRLPNKTDAAGAPDAATTDKGGVPHATATEKKPNEEITNAAKKINRPPIKPQEPPLFGPIERPEPIVFKPYLPKNEREVVTLPGSVIDATVGGGGRYLIFQSASSLAIFDVQAGVVVKQLPLVEDNALIAAGATGLIALYPNSKTLQSWNLTTFAKEKRVALPDAMTRDNIREISMGSASNGPLFAYLPKEKRTLAMNPATLQTTQVDWKHWGPSNAYGPLNMRTAPDGGVLVGWSGGWAGAQVATFRDGVQTGSNDQFGFSMGLFALPSEDGRRLFIPDAIDGIDGTDSKAPELGNAYAVPAHELGFYMTLQPKGRGPLSLPGRFNEVKVKLAPVGEVVVYSDDRHRLFSLSDVDGMEKGSNIFWERCVHYYPSAGLLVVLAAPDRLVLRRVDLVQQMEKAAANYLVVVSQPTIAKVGRMWDYRLDVKSKAGQVKVALESGPEGMTVTPDGQVKWLVPNDFVGTFATVKVSLEDAGGQESRHQFRVAVSPDKN
jgi:hypothetical protein